jgi:predicted RND superfamily exporter protein
VVADRVISRRVLVVHWKEHRHRLKIVSAYAFILVAGLSLLMIRRVRETLLALLPLTLGVLWTIGLMHVFGIRFNLANIWGLPLIIGTSAEFGLNVMLRYMEGRAHRGPLVARSTSWPSP